MAFYIKLDGDSDYCLPSEYILEDRIELCYKIIDEYPQYFDMTLNSTPHRLDVMGSYILEATNKDDDYPLLTSYKERRNKIKEVTFGELEQKYDNIDKNY